MRILFIICLLNQNIVAYADADIILDYSSSQTNLKEYSYHIEDSSNTLTIAQALSSEWSKLSGDVVFTPNKRIQWLRYNIVNPYDEDMVRVIFLPYHHIHEIDVYTYSDSILQHICKTGIKRPKANKHIKSIGYPIHVDLPAGKTTSVIIKLKHLYLPLQAKSYLMTLDRVNEIIINNHTLIWVWRGVFLLALFSSLVLFWITQLKLFIYYFFTNLGFGLFFASQIGDYFLFFDTDKTDITILINFSGTVLGICFLPLFLNSLTPIKKGNKLVWKWMYRFIYLMIPLSILSVFPQLRISKLIYFANFYFMITGGVVLLLQLYILFRNIVKREKNAIPLFIIYGVFIYSIFVEIIFPNIGLLHDSPYIHNRLVISSFVEIFCFMFLMGRETLSVFNQRAILLDRQQNHQKEMIVSMVRSQEEERDRIGREIHDMIGANMAVIKQHVTKDNGKLYSMVEQTIEKVRLLSHGLVTPGVEGDEFIDEINELCHLFSTKDLEVNHYFFAWPKIEDNEVTTHLYRITQEMLQNAVKHSKARHIYIQFTGEEHQGFSLSYEDDGIGFNYKKNKGLGLKNIENRVALLNGSLHIESSVESKGTTIMINVPLK